MDRTTRKQRGAFYTPPTLAERLVALALDHLGTVERALDPSVGAGAFLKPLRDRLPQAELVGFEADADALREAERLMTAARLERADFLSIEPQPRFDLVIGNPPWVSWAGRHAQRRTSERASAGWPSLHAEFVGRSAEWVRNGGLLAFIVPFSMLHQTRYGPTRAELRRKGRVLATERLPAHAFDGVNEPAAFLVWQRGEPDAEPPFAPFGPLLNETTERLLAKLNSQTGRATFFDIGVHTGNAATLLITEEPEPNAEPMREGADLEPFFAGPPKRYVRARAEIGPGYYARLGDASRQGPAPILLRQTADRPVAALQRDPARFRNSLLACGGMDGHDPRYVVALLNSRLIAFAFRASSPDSWQRAFPQVKVAPLKQLPFVQIPFRMDPKRRQTELETAVELAERWLQEHPPRFRT